MGRVAPEVVAEDRVAGRVRGHGHEPAAGGEHPPDPGQQLADLVGGEVLDEVGAEHPLVGPGRRLAVQEGHGVAADHVQALGHGRLDHALVGVDPLGLDALLVQQAEELAPAAAQLQHRALVLEHGHVVAQDLARVLGVEVHVRVVVALQPGHRFRPPLAWASRMTPALACYDGGSRPGHDLATTRRRGSMLSAGHQEEVRAMSGWSDEGAGDRRGRAGTAGERPQKPLPPGWSVRPRGMGQRAPRPATWTSATSGPASSASGRPGTRAAGGPRGPAGPAAGAAASAWSCWSWSLAAGRAGRLGRLPAQPGRRPGRLRGPARGHPGGRLADRRVRQPPGPRRGPPPRARHRPGRRAPGRHHDAAAHPPRHRQAGADQPAPRLLCADPGPGPQQAERGLRLRRPAAAGPHRRAGHRHPPRPLHGGRLRRLRQRGRRRRGRPDLPRPGDARPHGRAQRQGRLPGRGQQAGPGLCPHPGRRPRRPGPGRAPAGVPRLPDRQARPARGSSSTPSAASPCCSGAPRRSPSTRQPTSGT